MFLHEFMNQHREEILAACGEELEREEHGPDAHQEVREFYDEMLRAIRRDSGIPDSYSPLPGGSDTAARLGVEHYRAGIPIAKVPAIYGAISQAVAKTGERYELFIAAEEYKLLNKCLDVGLATSLENYSQRAKSRAAAQTTEVFGYLAHELRNALGNANMAWKLMRVGKLEVQGRTGDVLDRNLHRMGMLVAQILASARAQDSRLPPFAPVQVAAVLRDVEAAALPDRGIRIVLEVDEALFVRADELLLTTAIGNLVHNAVKFSKDDAIIRLCAQAQDDVVSIQVDDECGGLGRSELGELCQPYVTQRLGSQPGVGLGLAITKSAVETMNGELGVLDRPGQGCTFLLCFPLLRAD
jgi:signal transduction histidine kinase